jgi:uncharacterized protein
LPSNGGPKEARPERAEASREIGIATFPEQTMKLSYEKIIQLSHRIIDAIEGVDEFEIYEDPNTIRLEIVKILNDLAAEEEKIGEVVRQHITSQKRTIPEGSAEWDILYRKYYTDELRKLGIVAANFNR